ncbi:unnamed protein product [Orchesella dallaii]|uniref:Uncharacterized protein n=1 Tax=Orchesella dallaii TaxID=48710 RepID=A0ABP1PX65_9HEXA
MLFSEPKVRDIRRGQVGDIYLVPELCYPCEHTDEFRSNFRLMKELAHCLHLPPTGRVNTMQYTEVHGWDSPKRIGNCNQRKSCVEMDRSPVQMTKLIAQTLFKNVMILGYDVHHAGPGGGGLSIIVAMTATFNASLGRCFSTVARLPSGIWL